ncbi:MAG: stage II sporulation protein M [Candidatus Merdivicinus sp.]|jgi:stage II sporulation protein M
MERIQRIGQTESPAALPEKPLQTAPAPESEAERLLRAAKPSSHGTARKRSTLTTVLAVLFLVGVAYGAILVGYLDQETVAALDSITRGFLLGRAGDGFLSICLHSMASGMLLAGAIFLCGFSAVGQPFSLFFLLFRGIGLGISMGYFYSQMGGRGILLAMGMLLPSGALSGYALLLACRESLKLSGLFFRSMTAGAVMSVRTFRVYGIKFLILAGMQLAAALLDGVCSKIFAGLAV